VPGHALTFFQAGWFLPLPLSYSLFDGALDELVERPGSPPLGSLVGATSARLLILPKQPISSLVTLALHGDDSSLLEVIASQSLQQLSALPTAVDLQRDTTGLHAGSRVHSIPKEAVAGHL